MLSQAEVAICSVIKDHAFYEGISCIDSFLDKFCQVINAFLEFSFGKKENSLSECF